jgi:hypothetical protein
MEGGHRMLYALKYVSHSVITGSLKGIRSPFPTGFGLRRFCMLFFVSTSSSLVLLDHSGNDIFVALVTLTGFLIRVDLVSPSMTAAAYTLDGRLLKLL